MDDRFPLPYQVACVVLTALFIWAFSVAREPRGWRRLFQSMFAKPENFSVNKNKVIDEKLKSYGIAIAMVFLVADVGCFVAGITYNQRHKSTEISREDRLRMEEQRRLHSGSPGESRRGSMSTP